MKYYQTDINKPSLVFIWFFQGHQVAITVAYCYKFHNIQQAQIFHVLWIFLQFNQWSFCRESTKKAKTLG